MESCDECLLADEIHRLEKIEKELIEDVNYLEGILSEIQDLPVNPHFKDMTKDELLERIQRIATSALRRRW